MTSNWEAAMYNSQNQVPSAVHNRAVRGRGIVWNNGNGSRVFKTQPGMPIVETAPRHANHPGYRVVSAPRPQNFGVAPVVSQATGTGAQYSSEYPAQGQGQYMVVPGKQSAPARYPCEATLQGGVGYIPTQFNVANYGNAPANTFKPNILRTNAAAEQCRQKYTPAVTKAEVPLAPPTRHQNDYFATEMDNHHLLQFQLQALTIFGKGFGSSQFLLFDKLIHLRLVMESKPTSVFIHDDHVADVVYTATKGNRRFLGISLDERAFSHLSAKFNNDGAARCWPVFLHFVMHESHEQGLLTRLTECFGCKLNCVACSQWKRGLCQQVRDVAKHAHFLRRKCKEEEARKNSQMCAANGTGAALVQPAFSAGRMFDASVTPTNPTLPAPGEQGFSYMEGASNALPRAPEIRDYSCTAISRSSSETSLLTQGDSAAVGVFSQEWVSHVVQQTGAARNISNTAQNRKHQPVQQYRSASEFFSAFSGLNDNDFPADFLESDPPALEAIGASPAPTDVANPAETQMEEKAKGAPQIASQETLTLEDDDAAGAPDTLFFPNGVELSVESARETLTAGSLMYGAMASFLMKHYVPVALLPAQWPERNRVFFADSDAYNVISSRCRRLGLENNSVVTPAMAKVFQTKKGVLPPISRIVDSEITMIPLFWENHWILGVIQMFEPKERTVSGRFITVDSKFNDVINAAVLENITNKMYQEMLIGLKAGLILMNKNYGLAEFPLIRCERLPCQENHVDCGWFMMLFAEKFTKNMDWTRMSDDQIRLLEYPEQEKLEFRERIRMIRREVGAYLEHFAKRNLGFDYEKPFKYPTKEAPNHKFRQTL